VLILFLRSLFFALLFPGSVTVLFPYLIVSRRGAVMPSIASPICFLGLIPLVLGASILVRCIRDFAVIGRGTLATVDPPRVLVVSGLYRYVRNPMYVGVGFTLTGEAILFASAALVFYAVAVLTVMHLFVVLYEEPALTAQFGESYRQYRRDVRRWVPRWPPR